MMQRNIGVVLGRSWPSIVALAISPIMTSPLRTSIWIPSWRHFRSWESNWSSSWFSALSFGSRVEGASSQIHVRVSKIPLIPTLFIVSGKYERYINESMTYNSPRMNVFIKTYMRSFESSVLNSACSIKLREFEKILASRSDRPSVEILSSPGVSCPRSYFNTIIYLWLVLMPDITLLRCRRRKKLVEKTGLPYSLLPVRDSSTCHPCRYLMSPKSSP